jgi:hypothetical protein
MTDDTRYLVAISCFVLGLAWWLGEKVWRCFSREDSARMFWIHLTAPLVGIILMGAALWLFSMERMG